MAIRTQVLAEYDGGLVRVEYDWDDNASRRWLTAVRVVNNSAHAVYVEAVIAAGRPNAGRKASAIFLAGTTTEIAVPTGASQRIQGLYDAAHDQLDGLEITILYPYVA